MLGVVYLRVELHAVKAPALVADGHVGAGIGVRHQFKAIRHLLHVVAVAHPGNAIGRQSLEEFAVRVEIRFRLAVFPGRILRGRHHPASQIVGQQLAAVADAEDGNPQPENLRIGLRGSGVVHAVGAAGKDDADGVHRLDVRQRGGIGLDLAVHIALPDAPGNQLIVLSAEVKNQNHL